MNPKNVFDRVLVEFAGKRQANYRVKVFVDGNLYTPAGYVFGPGAKQETYRCEAEVLAGEAKPDVDENGKVKTGFVVEGDLGCDGLAGEAYKYIELPERTASPCTDSVTSPAEAAVEVAADTTRRLVRRQAADAAQ